MGGTETMKVNVRVIAATNRDLVSAMDQQKFREDLFYRLNVFPLHVPPLRERKSDIPILARYFVDKYGKILGKRFESIHAATLERLIQYPWPGNIREFENIIERAIILADGPILNIEESWPSLGPAKSRPSSEFVSLEDMERDYVLKVLQKTKWVIGGKKGAAEILSVHPNTLRSRLEKLGIHKPE